MPWSVQNQILDKMEQNFDTLKEAFKEFFETNVQGIAVQSNEQRQQAIETFQEAASFIEQKRDVNWEELEAIIVSYTTPRHRKSFIQHIGDKVNRTIAANLPEEGYPELKKIYRYYGQVGDSKNYQVNDIDSEKALIYITNIQEKTYIAGTRIAAATRPSFPKLNQDPNAPRRDKQPLAEEFKIGQLKSLQGKKGDSRPFTVIFKSIFEGDLDQQTQIANTLSQTMKNRTVNQKAVLDRIVELAYAVNQGDLTIEQASSASGLNLQIIEHLIPSIKSDDKDTFETELKNELFKDGAKGQRDVTRQFEIKMSNYRRGVPKIFKDFITDMFHKPNIYEETFNNIWTNSYSQFRLNHEFTHWRQLGNMLAKNGKTYPIWGLPRRTGNAKRIEIMYKFIILNDRSIDDDFSNKAQTAFRALRRLFNNFKKENIEDSEEELFGDLLNVTIADAPKIVQHFADPFEKAIAYLFLDVKDGNTKLEELTSKYEISLSKDINIINAIREVKETEKVVLRKAKVTQLLTGKYTNVLSQNISNDEIIPVVKQFIDDLNSIITEIRDGVKQLITDKLTRMVNNQGEYLPFNNAIFIILEGYGLISEV